MPWYDRLGRLPFQTDRANSTLVALIVEQHKMNAVSSTNIEIETI